MQNFRETQSYITSTERRLAGVPNGIWFFFARYEQPRKSTVRENPLELYIDFSL